MMDKKITAEDGKTKKNGATTQAATGTEQSAADTTHKDNPGPVAAQQQPATNDLRGYLANGYYKGEGKGRYPDPALVDQAEEIGKALAAGGMKQTAINPVLRELKRANKKTLPLDAKQGALAGAIVMAKQLQQRKRASALLVEVLERNRAAVQTDADYSAAVKHLTAVGVYLGEYQK